MFNMGLILITTGPAVSTSGSTANNFATNTEDRKKPTLPFLPEDLVRRWFSEQQKQQCMRNADCHTISLYISNRCSVWFPNELSIYNKH